MKLLIQLTFNKGSGNLYCNAVEILNFVTYYKNNGYECYLIFSSNGYLRKNKYINFIKFEDIFDLSLFNVFDTIRNFENSITLTEFEGFTYHSTQYGADHPGIHSWDVYVNKPINFLPYPKKRASLETLLLNNFEPNLVPKLNKKIHEKAFEFISNNKNVNKAIHIRHGDYQISPSNNFKEMSKNLLRIVNESNTIYHFLSNNQFIIDEMTKSPNIVKYNFKNLDTLSNDHPYYHHCDDVDYEILLERFYDNLTEMCVISYYDTIYYFTLVGPWTSTFLYYSKITNPNQKLINIRGNLDLITQ